MSLSAASLSFDRLLNASDGFAFGVFGVEPHTMIAKRESSSVIDVGAQRQAFGGPGKYGKRYEVVRFCGRGL